MRTHAFVFPLPLPVSFSAFWKTGEKRKKEDSVHGFYFSFWFFCLWSRSPIPNSASSVDFVIWFYFVFLQVLLTWSQVPHMYSALTDSKHWYFWGLCILNHCYLGILIFLHVRLAPIPTLHTIFGVSTSIPSPDYTLKLPSTGSCGPLKTGPFGLVWYNHLLQGMTLLAIF